MAEDRPEYERILDEALRSAPHRPELAAVGQRLNPEQLRTMALNATALITAAAAPEYQHYVKVREETRRTAATREPGAAEPDAGGIGVVGVIVVLSPVLAGTSAALFLLIGYILKMFSPEPAIAQTMLNAGWVFGAVTAAAILVAAVGLLLTALRNTSSPDPGPHGEPGDEVARAREAWRDALLERGILPFLREALVDPATAAALPARMSNRGHVRPGLGSPDDRPPAGPRPGFGTPDFTSPDFGGPERQPE
ncbi:hypothetical protein [Streptomyces lanatus]|uniref:Transmembrane protein n=1 Tax=Streptomyces lanatus TaxID=66900 RepID=A0ABV1XKL2_9ACTN|nr:hypothetical protein [Streptomyces lanatus]